MKNDIIVVEQLPIITQQLQLIKADVESRARAALSLPCTLETIQEVKKFRASLKKDFEEWENKRKDVKKAIMSPYEQFESVYKECITNIYTDTDEMLKKRISIIEQDQIAEKREKIESYFYAYQASVGLPFHIDFSRANIKIGLSNSDKSLKDACRQFIDDVMKDILLIETHQHADRVMLEYQETLDLRQSISIVEAREQALEEIKQKPPVKSEYREDDTIIVSPVVEDDKYAMTFTVRHTVEKLKKLKQYLIKEGYEII